MVVSIASILWQQDLQIRFQSNSEQWIMVVFFGLVLLLFAFWFPFFLTLASRPFKVTTHKSSCMTLTF